VIVNETSESQVVMKQSGNCGLISVTLSSKTPQSMITVNWRNGCDAAGRDDNETH